MLVLSGQELHLLCLTHTRLPHAGLHTGELVSGVIGTKLPKVRAQSSHASLSR